MSNRKARFVANAGSTRAELYAIRELGSGDLKIISRLNRHAEQPHGFDGIVDHTWTIHVSPESAIPGHTITQTTRLQRSEPARSRRFIDCQQDPLLNLVSARREPYLDRDFYVVKPRTKDLVLDTVTYDPTKQSLFHFLYVTEKGLTPLIPVAPQASNKVVHFRRFSLLLIAKVVDVPSIDQGAMMSVVNDTSDVQSRALTDFIPEVLYFCNALELEYYQRAVDGRLSIDDSIDDEVFIERLAVLIRDCA